ncbi:MAG TPA: peptide chain release factor aRF-1 [Methanocorpusculum sp.]|nr:peptide chain release factor aRF-1 [Methanocorpusculum sp.]
MADEISTYQIEKDVARNRYEFKKSIEKLEEKQGFGTELITLYIPPDKQIYDVTAQLRDEFGQCSNIKSKQTRTNVQSAISSILARLKYYKNPPENGMAVFCGAINIGGDKTNLETIIVEPPEAIHTYSYRCSSNFELEPLKAMLDDKFVYGLLVIDRREAYWGFLRGTRIEPINGTTSTVPGKQRKGGQSSIRFERLRLIAIHEFYKKVGERASDVFLAEPNFFEKFKGLLIGGPMPTKEEFAEGDFLHHEIKKRIIGLFDASYTNEFGLRELVDNAQDALRGVDITDEKKEMTRFFKELIKENSCAAYGEDSVRANLNAGAVDTLLLSEKLRKARLTIACGNCEYRDIKTMQIEAGKLFKDIPFGHCPKCQSPLFLADETDIIEELTQIADTSNTRVEIISDDFEEGSMLFSAFGGVAAVLRYPTGM